VALRQALQVSSDVFFYTMGARLNGESGDPLQRYARKLGIGRRTGIDIPGEFKGLLPTPQWRDRLFKERKTDRPWTIGDNVNLAVGQGDLQATPLQMATAYSTVINGGKVPRPHVGLEVEDAAGRTLQRIDPGAARHVKISPGNRQAILDGLHLAASAAGGTSADVFRGFPHPVYGKTGTAERPGQEDQSWYVCYVPDGKRPIVVAVTIEQGGFGAEAAAPAARLILSQWFGVKKKLVRGSSRTR
jgi:penicillin-binding protein 2